jgi:hypothetical protein
LHTGISTYWKFLQRGCRDCQVFICSSAGKGGREGGGEKRMGVGNASESVNILHINLITAIFIAVLRPPGEQPFYQKNTLSFRRKSSLPGKDSLIRKKCFLSGRPFNQDKTFYRKHCCGTGMFIPDPRSRFSYIPDPGTRIPEPGSRTPDLGSNKNKKQ